MPSPIKCSTFVLMVFLPLMWVAPPAMAQRGITMSLSPMEPQSQVAQVTATDVANVHFNLTVTVNIPSNSFFKVTVSFDGHTSTGWSTSTNPQSLQFRKSGSEPVNVTVVVPQGSLTDEQGKVTINATATYPGFRVDASSSAMVYVGQYFLWTVQSHGVSPITTNDTIALPVSITNTGNGLDQFEIGVNDKDEDTSPLGLHISIDKSMTKSLTPNSSDTFTITATYKGTKRPFGYIMTLRVISQEAKNAGDIYSGMIYGVPLLFNPSPPHNDTQKNSIIKAAQQSYVVEGIISASIIAVVITAIGIYKRRKKEPDLDRRQRPA